jgi:hypothetical protein
VAEDVTGVRFDLKANVQADLKVGLYAQDGERVGVRAGLKVGLYAWDRERVGVRAGLKVGFYGWAREPNAAWTPLATIIP